MRDADRIFHETWLGLAQPIEGLVFSVPVLAEAQIAPAPRPEITAEVRAQLEDRGDGTLALRSVRAFFENFLGYGAPGMLVNRPSLPTFYAPESRQEVKASFGIARVPTPPSDDPFAEFAQPSPAPSIDSTSNSNPIMALIWDLGDDAEDPLAIDLDAPEEATGPWRYPVTAKLERLLRHTGIPIGFVSNRRALRLVYAPPGETTSHLTFRIEDLADPAGRSIALALELLFHARRTFSADPRFTFEGLLAESRRRQADVTEKLAEQVFEAVEVLLSGFESAAARDIVGDRVDWLRAALEAGHLHEGVLNVVLRLVFVLYAEDRSLLPVDHPLYAEHLSVVGLYERLVHDAGAHPESMHHRSGAYGALVSLFRAIYFGVRHGSLHLPPRQGKLFDPSAYPFLEGGLPDWTAAVNLAEDRAEVHLPSVDDKTIYEVLDGLIVLDGQRLSYRVLSVEQIGAVYESLMGYRVERVAGPAVRLGKNGVWVEIETLRSATKAEQKKLLDDQCELSAAGVKNVLAALAEHEEGGEAAAAIAALSSKKRQLQNRARAGQLVLQPTATRRSTGSHYTPRSLSERVVGRTLEPILACLGDAPTAARILELKVCDPAMGSGAFLVEACRFLAEQIVEAWRRDGELPALVEEHGEPLVHAKRLVAERCLYGVDKNSAAVELAKLSLWLETMSAERSFTFLDHVLRHGDSLVGLDLTQIRAFHWAPEAQVPMVKLLVDQVLEEVREHRDAIQTMADDVSDDAQFEKRRLLELADLAIERVKLIADACIGAFFSSDKPKTREDVRKTRLRAVETWLGGDETRRTQVEEWSREIREKHSPFHWYLEFPEVFFLERPDPLEELRINRAAFVDAFVGNPPFLGGSKISGALGTEYLHWLMQMNQSADGRGDLCAHFLVRCHSLLGCNGSAGFVATNSIAQGDTRATGLLHLVRTGATIFAADPSSPWPGDANVSVAIVHFATGAPSKNASRRCLLDGVVVNHINSQLRAQPERPDPVALSSNSGRCYQGNKINGAGFVLTPLERDEFIQANAHNGLVIRPYLGGEEVNSSPTHDFHRYVIDFGARTLPDVSREWPALLERVERLVKPARFAVKDNTGKGGHGKKYWWQFLDRCDPLVDALRGLGRCLVVAGVTKHLVFAWQPLDRVLSNALFVFATETSSTFAVLQSRIHEGWARRLSSSMRNDLRYAPTDCYETFPFPQPDPCTVIPAIEAIGERLCRTRSEFMVATDQGLTQTYNHLKDPRCDDERVVALRHLHEEMDRSVLDAYGWTDIEVPPFCPKSPDETRSIEQFQDVVIDRLFLLNTARAEEERRLGAAKPQKKKRTASAKGSVADARKSKRTSPADQRALNLDNAAKEDA